MDVADDVTKSDAEKSNAETPANKGVSWAAILERNRKSCNCGRGFLCDCRNEGGTIIRYYKGDA